MKAIHTGFGSFLTGSEIADAVTGYGLELARGRLLDTVDVPFVELDGSVHRAQFRIGWCIETVVTSDEIVTDELIEADTIMSLLSRTSALREPRRRRAMFETEVPGERVNAVPWDEII